MAGLGAATVTVLANTTGFEASLISSFKRMSTQAAQFLIIGGAIAGLDFLGHAVKQAGDYEYALNRLVHAAGVAQGDLGAISDGMKKVSTSTGTALSDVASAEYILASAGYNTAASLVVLQNAAEAAKIENANLADVTNAVTSAMVDYHYTADQSSLVTNTLVAAVSVGKTNMEDLATAFTKVGAAAANARIPMADATAAIAEMTAHGTSAASAGTYLRQVISALEGQSAAAQGEMKKLGLNSLQLSADLGSGSGGLAKAIGDIQNAIAKNTGPDGFVKLQQLTTAANGSSADFDKTLKGMPTTFQSQFGALAKMVGGVRSLQGFLQLGGANLTDFEDKTKKVSAAAIAGGSSINGWAETSKTFNVEWDKVKAGIEVASTDIGTLLLPKLTLMLQWFLTQGPVISKFWQDNLQGPMDDIIKALEKVDWKAVFGDLSAALAGIGVVIGGILVVLPTVINLFSDFAKLIGPFAPVLTTVVALWAAWKVGMVLWNTATGIATATMGLFGGATATADGETAALSVNQDLLTAAIERVTVAIDFQSRALVGLDSSYAVAAASAGKLAAAEDVAGVSTGGLLAKFAGGSVLGVPAPIVAGALVGAGIAQVLSKYDTPNGEHNNNELATDQWTKGIQTLQKELDGLSDAKAKAQLTDMMKSAIATSDGQDHMAGALGAAQKVLNKYDASHGIQQNQALKGVIDQLSTSANDGTDAIAKLIAQGKVTASSPGLSAIDEQLRILTADGNAAAQAIFQAERQAANLTANAAINAADAAGISGEDAALGRAANGGYSDDELGNAQKAAANIGAAPIPVAPKNVGGSTGGSSASNAASAAKAALKKVGTDLTNIAKGIGKDTTAALDTAMTNLYSDLKSDKASAKLLASAKATWAALDKLAASRDSNVAAIKVQQDAITALQGSMTSLHDSVMGSFTSIVDISKYGSAGTGQLFADLHQTLAASTAFKNDIQTLAKMGLNQSALTELLNAGPANGDAAAKQLIAAGQAAITGAGGVNDLMGQISAQGDALGTAMGKQFYQGGIDAANGLIAGLQSKDKALEAQMTKMGDTMAASFKKSLGIKSPSTVFAEFGKQIPAGLAVGISGNMDVAHKALSGFGTGFSSPGMAGGGVEVHVHLGPEQLEPSMVRIINKQNRVNKARANAGSKVGNVAGRLS
jgi:TP901 family phage tail tape measure protein